MRRLVIDRSNVQGIILDDNKNPIPKPEIWYELIDDNFEEIFFLKNSIDRGCKIDFRPIKHEWGNIVEYKKNFKFVIGFWKEFINGNQT